MAFVAQVAGRRVSCYATANLVRDEADAMVPKFADSWREQTGHYPARLLFDSRATTYAGLNELVPVYQCGNSCCTGVWRMRVHSPMDDHWCFRSGTLAILHFAQLDPLLPSWMSSPVCCLQDVPAPTDLAPEHPTRTSRLLNLPVTGTALPSL